MRSRRNFKLLLKTPIACILLAFILLLMCIGAIIFNIYTASNGYIENIADLFLYFNENEFIILLIGISLFIFFMYYGYKALINKKELADITQNIIVNDINLNDNESFKFYTINFEGTTITFKAPANFKKIEDDEPIEFDLDDLERFADISFTTENAEMYTCYLHAPHAKHYVNAEEYVKYTLSECYDIKEKDKKLQIITLNNIVCYYYIVKYKNKFGKFQDLCAACDVENGNIYSVEIEYPGWDKNLTLNDVTCFFDKK